MKKIVPVFIFFLITVYFFKPFFLNRLLPIPADSLIGLYHPYRDLYANTNPNGISFKNFLITDPVRQQYPWRLLSYQLLYSRVIPLWNPYSFAGSPLLANFQTGVFYPLNVILFLIPFALGWSVLVYLQPVLAGFFLYLYLRKFRLSQTASLLGAVSFAFCGFSVAWMQWNTLMQVALWLPLILLAKERLIEKRTLVWGLILIGAEVSQIFAGHLQTWFYSVMVSNIYLFGRIIQISYQTKRKTYIISAIRSYLPFVCIGAVIFAVTALQWIPTIHFIQLSARSIDQTAWQDEGWFIPWQNLIQFIAPDFFGNPSTLNYWGVWNYAEFIGYIGILPLFFSIVALSFRRDKKTVFFGLLCLSSLLFALPTPLAKLPFLLHIPFISTAQPTRLLFLTDFSLVILAALGWDHMNTSKKTLFLPLLLFSLLFAALWVVVLLGFPAISLQHLQVAKRNLIFPTLLFALAAFVLIGKYIALHFRSNILIKVFSCGMIMLVVVDLFHFTNKFTPFTPAQYLYPQTASLAYLQSHAGNFRYMTTDSQLLPPNVSIVYHLQTVDGYDPLYLRSYAELIAASERGTPNFQPPFGFNRIITPHTYSSPIMNLLGVKYILSLSDITASGYKKVFQERQTRIYQNQNTLPRAFFVDKIVNTENKQTTMNFLFDPAINLRTSAIVSAVGSPKFFSRGYANIITYNSNTIQIRTQNTGEGFLILTDVFYPSWVALVDGQETQMYLTDFTFRGIYVPKGRHTIMFTQKYW